MQFLQGIPQIIIVRILYRIKSAIHHRCGLAIAGQWHGSRIIIACYRITYSGILHILNGSCQETYLTFFQRIYIYQGWFKHAYLSYFENLFRSHHANSHTFFQGTVNNPDIQHNTLVGIKLRIEYQGLQRRITISGGRRNTFNNSFQNIVYTQPCLGTAQYCLGSINTQDFLHFLFNQVRISTR